MEGGKFISGPAVKRAVICLEYMDGQTIDVSYDDHECSIIHGQFSEEVKFTKRPQEGPVAFTVVPTGEVVVSLTLRLALRSDHPLITPTVESDSK